MAYKIGVIRGDGIVPEIVAESLKVLGKITENLNKYTSGKIDCTDNVQICKKFKNDSL